MTCRAVVVLVVAVLIGPFALAQTRNVSGHWMDANWSGGSPPTVSSSATILGGNVTVVDGRSVGSVTLSGGALDTTGALTVVSTAALTSGTLSGAGSLTVGGLLTWSGSTISGPGSLHANGGIAVTNTVNLNGGRALTLGSNSTWTAGTIYGGGNTAVNVASGASFSTNFDGSWENYYSGGATTIQNQGTFAKTGGTGATTLATAFNNTGTVSVQSGTLRMTGGGTSSGIMNVSAGATLELTSNYTFGNGSILDGTGTVRVAGNTTTFAGSHTGTASLAIANGTGTFDGATTTSGSATLSGGTLNGIGTLNIGGPLTWNGTTVSGTGTLNANGGAVISNTVNLNGGRTVTLGANSTWSGGTIYGGGNTVVNVAPGVTFATNFDNSFENYYSGGATTVQNQGTFAKTGGTGVTTLATIFNNTGTVSVQSGTLRMSGGGSNSGTVNVGVGAALELVSNYSFANGSVLAGAGTVRIASNTTTFSGTHSGAANLALSGGTGTFDGTTSTSGTAALSGGTLNGAGSLSVGGLVTWNGTTVTGTGTLNANGGAVISNTVNLNGGRTVNLGANSTWSGGTIYGGGNTVVNVAPGVTFATNFDNSFENYYSGGATTVQNQGTFAKTGGTGATTLATIFNNTGTISVQSGTLRMSGGGSNSGTVNVNAGTSLELTSNYTFANGSILNGAGTVRVAGNTTTFTGSHSGTASLAVATGTGTFDGTTSTSGSATLSGGTLNGTGTLTIGGPLTWNGTTIAGTGTLNANGGATITNTVNLNGGRTLNMGASSTWSGGTIYGGGNSVINVASGATFSTNFDSSLENYYSGGATTLHNQGTFAKTGGSGVTNLGVVFNNAGTLSVQSGTLRLSSGGSSAGTVNVSPGAAMELTSNYSFTNGAILNGGGTVRVAANTTTFTGSHTGAAHLAVSGGVGSFNGTTVTTGGASLSGGTLNGTGTLTIGGLLTWSGTTLSGTGIVHANGGAAIANTVNFDGGRTLNLGGNSTWSNGTIYGGGNTVMNVASGVTLANTFDGQFANYYSGGATTLNNHGTFTKTAGTGATELGVFLNNTGSIQSTSGTLRLGGGGSNAGGASLLAGLGAEIAISNNFTLNDGSLLNGDGIVRFTNGILALTGTATFGRFSFDGGQFAGTHNLLGEVTWRGGDWSTGAVGPSTTIAPGAKLILASSSQHDFNRRALINQGTVEWEGHYIRSGQGGSFTNFAGALFKDMTPAGTHYIYSDTGGTFTFANHGTYSKLGAGTTLMQVPFDNTAAVSVQAGRLRLEGGGANAGTGSFSTAAGAVTEFASDFSVGNGSALTGAGTYRLAGGTLTVNGNIAVGNFHQNGGRLAGSQTFTSGTFDWNSGDWNAGALGPTTTIAAGVTLNLLSTNTHDFNHRAVTNHGSVNWHGHYVRSGQGGSFTNATGGQFNDLTPGGTHYIYSDSGGGFTFTNNGAYTKTGVGTTSMEAVFNNNAAVNVGAGRLHLQNGGTNTGTFHTGTGAVTQFGNSYTIGNGSALTGPGTYVLAGGTLTVDGNIAVSTFHQQSGRLAGSQTFTTGIFNWSSGDWNAPALGSTTIIDPGATLNLLNSNTHDFNQRAVTNRGTVNWDGHYIRSGQGGSFTNAAGGQFVDLTPGGTHYIYSDVGGGFTFTNDGVYTKSGVGTTAVQTTFNNNAAVHVNAGRLHLQGGGTNSGSGVFHTASGATTEFGSDYSIGDGSSLAGLGTYILANGTLTVGGNVSVSTFHQTGGRLAGSQAFTNGTLHWNSGDWNAGAVGPTTMIGQGVTLNLHNSNTHDFNARAVTNAGIMNWNGHYIRSGNGGSLLNDTTGVFNDLTPGGTHYIYSDVGGPFNVINKGLYHKTGAGTTEIQVPFTNNGGNVAVNNGTLRFVGAFLQSSGSLALTNNATVRFDQATTVSGTLSGHGTIDTANLTSGGILSPGEGVGNLGITGNLTLLSTSTLLIELGATADFLSVGGNGMLNGTLAVHLVSGFVTPAPGASVAVFTANGPSGLTGAFANIANGQRLFTTDGLGSFQVNYGLGSAFAANSVVLSSFTAVPEPSTWAQLLLGASAVFLILRRRR